jgi:diketogulonate reductase-like aldo/keto reductase
VLSRAFVLRSRNLLASGIGSGEVGLRLIGDPESMELSHCLSRCLSEVLARTMATKTTLLSNGVAMPVFQLGTAHLVPSPNRSDGGADALPNGFVGFLPERTYRQIDLALQSNIRAFDTAAIYRSHRQIGTVLGEWWRSGKLESRSSVWITSKIFHPLASVAFRRSHLSDLSSMTVEEVRESVRRQFEESLDDLGAGYVDLMLLHWPSGHQPSDEDDASSPKLLARQRRLAAWSVLEEVYGLGWARSIGVSNFSPVHLEQLKEDGAIIRPMVNQIEASVTLQYTNILEYCLANDIVPQAYSPFGRGYRELPSRVHELAVKYNKDAGQIALRYLLQLGYSVTYLTTSENRMVSNTQLFDFELSQGEMDELATFNRPDGGWGLPDPNGLD